MVITTVKQLVEALKKSEILMYGLGSKSFFTFVKTRTRTTVVVPDVVVPDVVLQALCKGYIICEGMDQQEFIARFVLKTLPIGAGGFWFRLSSSVNTLMEINNE